LVPDGRVLFDPPIMLPEPEPPVPDPVEPLGPVVVVELEHPVSANVAVSAISAIAATLERTSLMSSYLPAPGVQPGIRPVFRVPRLDHRPAPAFNLAGGALHAEVPAAETVLRPHGAFVAQAAVGRHVALGSVA
jgi:hypothetical protein